MMNKKLYLMELGEGIERMYEKELNMKKPKRHLKGKESEKAHPMM